MCGVLVDETRMDYFNNYSTQQNSYKDGACEVKRPMYLRNSFVASLL